MNLLSSKFFASFTVVYIYLIMGILLSFCTAHLLTTVHVHLEQRLQFTVNKSYFDEKTLTKEDYSSPMEFVQVNAQKKAEEVASRMSDKFDLIIGNFSILSIVCLIFC